MSAERKLFLLDGHAMVFRAYYAFINRPLVNSKGLNTSAISGFVRMLWKILKEENPSHLAVSFDLPGGTFRNEIYPEYKANRDDPPEDITTSLPYIKNIVRAFNIPILEVENYEADDVIGTIAKKAEKQGFKVFMVTPDKDYGQLVSENIVLAKPSRRGNDMDLLGPDEITEQWNISRPGQVIDMLGMAGDSSDNIPGVPGVGPKTGAKLLKKYDSLEEILANTDELKGKRKENFIKFAEQARLSKTLATINLETPVTFDPDHCKVSEPERSKLAEMFKELEFRTLARDILETKKKEKTEFQEQSLFAKESGDSTPDLKEHSIAEKTIEDTEHEYLLVQEEKDLRKLAKTLGKAEIFCFDTETTSLDPMQAELVGISFSIEEGKAWYIHIPPPEEKDDVNFSETLAHFANILEDKNIKKVAQNIKYDILVLRNYGIKVRGELEDTMIMHYLLAPELRHNMDYLAETYLKYKPIPIKNIIGKKKNAAKMRELPPEEVLDYAAEDADITLQLYNILKEKMTDPALLKIYREIEMPLVYVLVEMEYAGIALDIPIMERYSEELGKKIEKFKKGIYEEAGEEFNINSPKQVGEILFDKMEIPYRWRKTKTGNHSTSEEKMNELKAEHDIVRNILEYRALAKLKSTYVDALPKMVNARTGRVHTSYNQALVSSGRLSSNNPNLQNIPIRTEEGRKVRTAFVPADENHLLYAADYSQVELRVISSISGDEAMMEAFQQGQDIHRATAARVFDVDYDAVTADQRRTAKTVNFSITYGAGATNLSRQLDISRKEAKRLIEQYFRQYSGLRAYMDKTVESARSNGYVQTLFGRKLHLRNINSRNGMLRSQAERIAINMPIQGTAADLIKVAMLEVQKHLVKHKLKTRMLLQVHDELVFDLHRKERDSLVPKIEEMMASALPELKVPLLVEGDVGENWLEAH